MKRLITVLWIVFLISLTSVQAQDDSVTLVVWGEPGTVSCINDPANDWEFCTYVRYLNDTWAEMYPDIELEWVDNGWEDDLKSALLTAIEDGNAPDITVGESFMPQLVNEGLLLPLELPAETRENLIPATIKAVTDGDDLYGVAAFTAVFTLEVNTDVLLLAGLNPNTVDLSTWEQVEAVAAQVTENGMGQFYGFSILGPTPAPIAALLRAAPYVYQSGADFCNMPDCDTPTFDDPAAVPVYEWFRRMYQYTPPGLVFNGDEGFVFSQLFSGVTAMQTAGSWHPSWAAGSGCVDCRYYPLPLPEDGDRANIVVGNAMYGMLASTEHPEEAQMFLEWLVDDAVQTRVFWTGVGGRLPTTYSAIGALRDVMAGDTEPVPAFYSEVLGRDVASAPEEIAVYDVFIDELLEGDVRSLPPWTAKGTELNSLWNEMFAEILSSDEPVESIMATYQAEAEAVMAAE